MPKAKTPGELLKAEKQCETAIDGFIQSQTQKSAAGKLPTTNLETAAILDIIPSLDPF